MTRSSRLPHRSHLARRGLAGALTALVLVGVSACGGSDGSDGSDAEATDDTGASSSAEASPEQDAESQAPSGDAGDGGDGESVDPADFVELFKASVTQESTARIGIETTGSGIGLSGEGEIDLGTDPPSMTLTTRLGADGGVELRLVDGTFYVQLPGSGGQFVRYDLDDPANPLGEAFVDQLDIESQLDTFAGAIQQVTLVGTEDVAGEELERYELTVDSAALAEVAGGTALEGSADLLPDEITYDVFFDADGLFRQLAFDLEEQGVSSTITYSDWGTDVSITAPDPSEITTMPGAPG